jgi:hypothetical protein
LISQVCKLKQVKTLQNAPRRNANNKLQSLLKVKEKEKEQMATRQADVQGMVTVRIEMLQVALYFVVSGRRIRKRTSKAG